MQDVVDLKKVVEGIISSYEKRIENISSLFDTTYLILNDFQESILNTKEEQDTINTQLRDTLARNEHLRRKDFDQMMQSILQAQDGREREVRNLLRNHLNDQKAMAQALRENLEKFKDSLAKGEARRVKESQTLIKEILDAQVARKNEVTSKLNEFQREQQILASSLKGLLAKGRELRIKDLKAMLRDFQAQRERRSVVQRRRKEEAIERKAEVARMLGGFKEARVKFQPSSRAIHPALLANPKGHKLPQKGGVDIDAHNERGEEGVGKINKEIERRE